MSRAKIIDGAVQTDLEDYIEHIEADNVEHFPGPFYGKIEPNKMMASAFNRLDQLIMVGMDNDGQFFLTMSMPEPEIANWLLTKAQHKLMKIVDELEEEGDEDIAPLVPRE